MEMFDHWDQTAQDGNDTETNLVVVALCVGIGFVASAAVTKSIRPRRTCPLGSVSLSSEPVTTALRLTGAVFSANGPPGPLRM